MPMNIHHHYHSSKMTKYSDRYHWPFQQQQRRRRPRYYYHDDSSVIQSMKQWFSSSRIVRWMCLLLVFLIMMIRSIVFPPPVVVPTLKTIPALLLPIPHRILFTYKSNILETKEPKLYYENIQNTIQQYQTFWTKQQQPEEEPNINNIAVEFLDNAACRHHIEIAAPALVPYFDTEPKGMFKGDMCRTAALYNQGGYYFDVDIHVIQPISLEYNISFATVVSSSGVFFQAFLASTKHHPILQRTLQEMLHYYQNKPLVQWFLGLPMGCETLTRAYQSLTRHQRGNTRILQEMNLASIWKKNLYYPQLPRQVGKGHLCNYIVHDALEQQPYFFSRLVGSFRCPYPNTTYTQFLWQWLGNE